MTRRLAALRPKPLRDWTLRARLLAGLLGLLAVVSLGVGTFTEISLQHFLIGRLDNQLTATDHRNSVGFHGFGPPPAGGGPTGGEAVAPLPQGVGEGTIGLRADDTGSVVATYRPATGADRVLSAQAAAVLENVSRDGEPHTVGLPGYGQYRVAARTTPTGTLLVTGLPLKDVTATLVRLTVVITAFTAAGLLIAAFLGAFIVRLALRPLRRVTTTASKVAEMSLDEGEVALAVRVPNPNPHTEVGQVGVALNRMLENVNDALNARHQSETRVRQFVADASHELRTPLASIRGYAELTRRSREIAPPDIAHAMTRVEAEASRMTTLVEDLLLLARLDAGRPLASDDVDLTRLVVDVLSDAHAAGPDHQWHLDLGEEPVTVRGDAARLQQVLVNILGNARSHTPAGTNIWMSLAELDGTAVISVRDDGPGISAELIPEIFERFSRGEESRSRAAGSTGLGLAIVAAVVTAHRGHISVQSRPGETIFTVRLPMHGSVQATSQTPSSSAGQFLQV